MARFTHASAQEHDRLIRPNEYLLFEAPPEDVLEIHQFATSGKTLLQSLICNELRVSDELIETMLYWVS